MPLFEYHCEQCQDRVEILVRNSETPKCPQCEGSQLEKLISAASGHVIGQTLPVMNGGCPPSDAPLCRPNCCRAPQ